MSLQSRLRDTWLPRPFSRFFAASFRWNVPSSCKTNSVRSGTGNIKNTATKREEVADLYGENEDSPPSHHVEEQDHGFVLMGGVGVKYSLGHDMTLAHRKNNGYLSLKKKLEAC